MSNWANIRLVVLGKHSDVVRFSRAVPVNRPSPVFANYMLEGEGGELHAERLKRRAPTVSEKVYNFQLPNDDGREHFKTISKNHPKLHFILVFFDPNCDERGSYLIHKGRSRQFLLLSEPWDKILQKHGYVYDDDSDDNEWVYWEASWEAMDICQERWERRFVHTKSKTRYSSVRI